MVTFSQKKKTVIIQSSIQCEMCVERLDNIFVSIWAVKYVHYNLDDKTITVQYNSKKVTLDEIRKKIVLVGYDADEFVANKEAYDKLPKCCQKFSKQCDM